MRLRDRLAARFGDRRPTQAAAVLDRLPPEDAARFLSGVDVEFAAGLVRRMAPRAAAESIGSVERPVAEELLEALPDHRCAALLRFLEPDRRRVVADALHAKRRKRVLRLVSFPVDTAGALAEIPEVVLRGSWAVEDAMPSVAGRAASEFWVIDDDDRLLGTVSREALAGVAAAGPLLAELARPIATTVPATAPAAAVLRLGIWSERDDLPVCDARREFIGVLSHRTLRRATARKPSGPTGAGSNLGMWLDLGEAYWSGLTVVLSAATGANRQGDEEEGDGR